jgi:argininosuccinate lyase
MTLWGGVFSEPSDADLRALNDSLPFDKRMYAQDIRGSIAWANALARAGVLTADEAATLIVGLEKVKAEWDAGTFEIAAGDEDIHTAVERRLTEIVGEVGGKLHTGRSRNDQVATDFRLWVLDATDKMSAHLVALIAALIERADEHADNVMAGFTHLQPAQPITAGHWLMSFVWMLFRDLERLEQAKARCAVMPLGNSALAGTPYPIDRAALAAELGFSAPTFNSLDGVSDRDFAADFLYALSMVGTHLSRLAEDIIIYSNPAFGYVTLSDRYSTGSSIMPQKRNADPMELARGKAGRLIGHLTGLLTTLKGLPSTYNKDIQEDKEPVFDAFDTMAIILPTVTGVIRTMTLHPERMRSGLAPEMLATELADYLVVKKGLPFRQAHHIAGRAVKLAREKAVPFDQLTPDDLRTLSPLFDDDVTGAFSYEASVAARNTIGGTSPESVRAQIAEARRRLG